MVPQIAQNILSRAYDKDKQALRVLGLEVQLEVTDLQIGAVELKDSVTNNRATVDSFGALLVRQAEISTPVYEAGQISATAGVYDTILTYTVPVGLTFHFQGFVISGANEGKFEVLIDSLPAFAYRTSRATLSHDKDLGKSALQVGAGLDISVRVRNAFSEDSDFEATIYGYLT